VDSTRRVGRELTPGSIFEGRYQVLEELGRGGMGVVYKAEDSKLRRHVALKFLPSDLTRRPEAKERFVHEARAASALDHPNICTVYEIDETADGQMFISMGCYDGETLEKKIESGPLRVEEATSIGIQVAQGLAEAHEKGIVHRDVKPSNIIVTRKGQAKIMDFGLAKLAGQTRLTRAGTTMGTVAYMSPEQAQGEDVDHRTDIWSLGTVLYEMSTGQQPFGGEYDQAVIYSILNEEARPISETGTSVPAEFEKIIRRCLEKEPRDRYQSVADLEQDLRRFRKDSGLDHVTLWDDAIGLRARPDSRVRRAVLWGAVAVAVVVALTLPQSRNTIKGLLGLEPAPTERRVAILPCNLVGGTTDDQAFCDGMTKVMTDKLAKIERFYEDLAVVRAQDVRELGTISAIDARRNLNANVVVAGSMGLSGNDIRVVLLRNDLAGETDQSSEVKILRERQSDPISDPLANVSTWQDSLVVELARLLDVELTQEARETLFLGGTTIPEAYRFYLTGMGYVFSYGVDQDLDAGIDMFERAIAEDSSYAQAYIGLAEACMLKVSGDEGHEWAGRAIWACDRALEADGRVAEAHIVAGFANHHAGNADDAIGRLRLALELDPASDRAYSGLGKVYTAIGEYGLAAEAYRRAVELRPNTAKYYQRLGYVCLREGDYDEAIEAYTEVTELNPVDHTVYTNLGVIYFFLDRLSEARDSFEKSRAIKPTYKACTNLGNVYYWEARYADAARMYVQALELETGDYKVWGHLADSYYWSPGEREKAKENFEEAVRLAEVCLREDPEDAEILSNLASYHAMLGHRADAESLLTLAIGQEPADHGVMLHIAETCEHLGQRERALEWVRKALDGGAPLLKVERYPGLRGLRSDPRFRSWREGSVDESTT
jgi:tetratricopeptide (TPR) repeat protein/tRNA A-37 threonylcarbamoyl transferase component Bud32/TolB-like protein